MAKVPVKAKPGQKKPVPKAAAKKPAAKTKHFVPDQTLKPGQKKKLSIKMIKSKLVKLNAIKEELQKLESAQRMAKNIGPTSFANKALIAKMAEFHALLDAEQTRQLKLLAIAQKEIKNDKTVDPLIAIIEKECSQALAVYRAKGSVLYRGASSKTNPPLFHGRSHANRTVLNSDSLGQEIYDYALTKMGIKALRSNSIFTTSDEYQASSYGDAMYVIIPKNGFEFSWSLYEPDLVLDDIEALLKENVIETIMNNIDKFIENSPKINDNAGTWYTKLTLNGLESSKKWLESIGYPKENIQQITLDKLIDFKSIKENMGPTNKDFAKALVSRGEVLIHGEYYGMNVKQYADILHTVMGLKISVDDED